MHYDLPSNAQEALEAVLDLVEGTPAADIIEDILEIIGHPHDPIGNGNGNAYGHNNGNNGNHNGHDFEDDFEVTPVVVNLEDNDFNTVEETDTIEAGEGTDTIETGEGFDVADVQLLLDQGLSLTDIVENFAKPAELNDAFTELLNILEQSSDEAAEVYPVEQPEGDASADAAVTIGIIGSAEASGTADNVQIIPGDQV